MTALFAILTAQVLDPVRIALVVAGSWAALYARGVARYSILALTVALTAGLIALMLRPPLFAESIFFGVIANLLIVGVFFGVHRLVSRRP